MASLLKRGNVYYARYWLAKRQRTVCLHTKSYAFAKEKLREIESGLARGAGSPLPSKTPVAKVLSAYVEAMRATKTKNTVKSELYYLRDIFGPVCPELEPGRKTPERKAGDKRARPTLHIEAPWFENISTPQIASLILDRVQGRGLSPKTCNHYRSILSRLFSWAMSQYGVKMPGDLNPAAKTERFRERAKPIRFLTLVQIDEQLEALEENPEIQTMVALFIYAGLRREEALWLTQDDVKLKSGKYGIIQVQAKTVNGESWGPKTKVNRIVPVSSALRKYLDRYAVRIVPGGWYFPSPQGRRWHPDNFSQGLRARNNAAGLPWSCLDYRHSFGSHLAMKGESLYKIATLMGNSPEICRRHYATLLPESLMNSVEFTTEAEHAAAPPPIVQRPKLYLMSRPGEEEQHA